MKKIGLAFLLVSVFSAHAQRVIVALDAPARVRFGAEKLEAALKEAHVSGRKVTLRIVPDTAKESFRISGEGKTIHIDGADASGVLYGCLELADTIRRRGWPDRISVADHPRMALRGTCIGLQKPTLLPGRGPYEYPYTPENFPWFYDKALWIKYLDSMVSCRMNTLYLWNGHPFASLVRVPDYPFAVEVDDSTFRKNEEVYAFLTKEADKRGIWVIQLFYNIIVSKPLAEHYKIKTQDRSRPIVPLIADYTRKSIAAFVEKYPNVGLMVTLGEAMEGVGQDDIDWFTKTIIPGIKDGLRASGRKEEPPLVLRAHDTDGPADLKAADSLYKNLYVEAKYNGEALTTYTPHGSWAALHRELSKNSKGLIENVHILANLEPFRYGSDDFIQKSVQAMHSVYGASGLHLYPQASYWDWPYSADSADPRLLEMDRDWIWYKEWARYAWNADRDRDAEQAYWSNLLAFRYGCSLADGRSILEAYEQSGEIAPKLLRRFGITDGNRQTLNLGMLLAQLTDPDKFGLFSLLYESEGPPGESLSTYAERECRHQPHEGETPMSVIREVTEEGRLAVDAIEKASTGVKADRAEFLRLKNDMYCYKALANFYALKASAALEVLYWRNTHVAWHLDSAASLLQRSVAAFRELDRFAGPAYRYANSMQTQQRKIPVRGADGKFITWGELLPVYEKELADFRVHKDSAHEVGLKPAAVELAADSATAYYSVGDFAKPFTDSGAVIVSVDDALKGLQGIRESAQRQLKEGTKIEFTCTTTVQLLMGFFTQKSPAYCAAPQLETDASANDFGQAEPRIPNGVKIDGFPTVNVHAWTFKPGKHVLVLGKGLCLVLGFAKPAGAAGVGDAEAMSGAAADGVVGGPAGEMRLWYRQAAERWTEALPIGNGRLGAMIFGGIGEEHIQFNESTLWSGYPRNPARADAWHYLDTLRRMVSNGRQAEAEKLAGDRFMGKKDGDDSEYQMAKEAWIKKVRSDTSWSKVDLDDRDWKTMTTPTPDGWEAAGLQGLDGSVWFRRTFDMPDTGDHKYYMLQLGRIRDVDFTYVNGVLVGSEEGISKKRAYRLNRSLLKPTGNVVAIQVLNFDDKGGLTGIKGQLDTTVWKYKIQDDNPPMLPKYEADYQPFGDWWVETAGRKEQYRRELSLDSAIVRVSYVDSGVHYTREYFASAPGQVIVGKFSADKPGRITLKSRLTAVHRGYVVRKIDANTLGLFIKVRNGVLKGVSMLRAVSSGGRVKVSDSGIVVEHADAVTFYLAAATSFRDYQHVDADAAARCRTVLAGVKAYEKMRAEHVKEYQKIYNRFSIRLGGNEPRGRGAGEAAPTDQRIALYASGSLGQPPSDPGLVALYVQYARYLLIASSRPGSPLPANLQGIWNDLLSPPWGSKFTTNINLEMNYWPAEELNLPGCSEPLFRFIRSLLQAGQATARGNYHADGWVLHHNTDIWRATAPINASNHGIWVSGGAWLCHQLWEHYLYTKDVAFLKEYYPAMRSAALFFTEYLTRESGHGWLISSPSNSPEHGGLVAGPTMDHQIIRDLFKNCIDAERVLGLYPEFAQLMAKDYKELAPNQVGRYGQLQEWLEDKDDTADTHRHISHLWGVYPGTDITWADTAMMTAARRSMLYRGDEGTGWSLAWKVNCWARFKDGDHAMKLLDKLLSPAPPPGESGEHGGVYPNLFDAHPPFQIDGNFGGAAGLAEMLLQSQGDVIELLPALPAALPDGEVKGLCARGGFVVDMKWTHGKLEWVKIASASGGSCALSYGGKKIDVRLQKNGNYTYKF